MTTAVLALCLGLAFWGLVAAGTSLLIAAVAPRVIARIDGATAASRARAYLALRLAPTVTAVLLVTTILLPTFVAREPADSGERVGLLLLPAAGVLAMIALGLARAVRSAWSTRTLRRAWLADAQPLGPVPGIELPAFAVTTRFPLIAVVGIRRPVLLLSKRVLQACSQAEIDAIVAHEARHLSARDNLTRLLLLSLPDAVFAPALMRRLERGWSEASEQAADDAAGTEAAPLLASALVRVARMTGTAAPPPATVAALTRGGAVSERVERLVARTPGDSGSDLRRIQWLVLASLAAVWVALAATPAVRDLVHLLAESLVASLQ